VLGGWLIAADAHMWWIVDASMVSVAVPMADEFETMQPRPLGASGHWRHRCARERDDPWRHNHRDSACHTVSAATSLQRDCLAVPSLPSPQRIGSKRALGFLWVEALARLTKSLVIGTEA
jgi:hypothetical protein